MPGVLIRLVTAALAMVLTAAPAFSARNEVKLAGSDVPEHYFTGSRFIFYNSDSLFLNGRLLRRDLDYIFDTRRGTFDLSRLETQADDTLAIVFHPVPSWLQSFYGTPMPETTPSGSVPPIYMPQTQHAGRGRGAGDIDISGAKTFRFTTRSAGASNFSQSLDLNVTGEVAPGLELTGAISDRGYDPSYGTANSRLNELDKINLKLTSTAFAAQVGDILLDEKEFNVAGNKRVSGASVRVHRRRGYINAAAARPRGRFETVRFTGRDNTQGPYQIGRGSTGTSIVPGSETVWLDGTRLERGANKDYIVDYPTGRITFNVNHPIDSRSRIEVDYDPLLTAYRGELFATGGGVSLADSSVSIDVQWLREGDDKDEPFTGELTNEELDLLQAAGDQIENAIRSGVVADSLGNYMLVTDSLPDSVYQFVGEGNGQYTVTFSFVGSGQGDYVFLGGSQYRYVGQGDGDYRPVILIPVPERIDYYRSTLRLQNHLVTEFLADLQQTRHDRNLHSGLDDNDNDGLYYSFTALQEWQFRGRKNSMSVGTRRKEARFRDRGRLYRPDFERSYFVPTGFQALTDEVMYDLSGLIFPSAAVALKPSFSRLSYTDRLACQTGGLDLALEPSQKYRITAGWNTIRTDLDSAGTERTGEADSYRAGVSVSPATGLRFGSEYEHDSRTNDYAFDLRGTRFHRIETTVGNRTEQLAHEYFTEDSLSAEWTEQLRRNRLSASSSRKIGSLSYSALTTYQWLKMPGRDEESFLSRVGLDYSNARRGVELGASYAISEETRNGRGVAYIEVERGEGNYILEEGEFVPDPDGNFIRVEENLSETSRVRRGEKSFHLTRAWQIVLLRVNSNIEEELLPGGKRELWWIVPVLSDKDQPYLFYSRRHDVDLRLLPIRSGHAVNLSYNENREVRSVAEIPRRRDDFNAAIILKQVVRRSFFDQQFEWFQFNRDDYFSGAGEIDGFRIGSGYGHTLGTSEVSTSIGFRRADSEANERSDLYHWKVGSRLQVLRKGELRASAELYRQFLEGVTGTPSFLLTDNRPGTRGANWSIVLRYGIKGGMRVNFSISGRHADNRVARITGRGEFVAGF
ncbi:MAG: hypothetical protein JSU74_07480 [Candidatus Zixiibacteriota bacterium]|nr:MAG: hypothetical protein JSU74_07480 [candidate division Zixibacteria bacterium]